MDVLTGDTFNLKPLSSSVFKTTMDGVTYNLGVCSQAKDCPDGSGACRIASDGSSTNMGKTTTRLTFDDGLLSATLTGGVACKSGDSFTTTVIFECNLDATPDKAPVFKLLEYSTSSCSATFVVETSTRCHSFKEVPCLASDSATGNTFDLSVLANARENWVAEDSREDNKYSYVINVCRTLVPVRDQPDCSLMSAACQISNTDGTFSEKVCSRKRPRV